MAKLVGRETYDERLWRARLSPPGVDKKTNTLVSSYLWSGHLLGQLLSRILMILGDWRIDDIRFEIQRTIFANVDLAHAILDLTEGDQSAIAANSRRESLIRAFRDAVDQLTAELSHGPSVEYSARLKTGKDGLIQRMQPLAAEFAKPFKFTPNLENIDLRAGGQAIANQAYSLRPVASLGTAPVDLIDAATQVSCVADGNGDDDHIAIAFRRARIPNEIIESAQSAADILTGAPEANADRPTGPASRRRIAADVVKIIVELIADVSFNLESLEPCGVGKRSIETRISSACWLGSRTR